MSAAMCTPVKRNRNGRVPFDRTSPEPPKYLYAMRSVGHWRRWRHRGTFRELSTAVRNLNRDKWLSTKGDWILPVVRECVLDAGCGHSSDAFYAMQRFGFKEGIKVDLFQPYETIPCFRDKMEKHEKHRTRFVQGDICKLTDFIPLNSVDLIVCSAVLDCMDVYDRALFYNEASEVLRPGGVLSIYWCWLMNGHNDWDGSTELTNALERGLDLEHRISPYAFVLRKPTDKEGS